MSGNELREAYLQFFSEKKGHLRLPSFSLIPQDDPTLLLIGAGMAPLKPFFTGKMKPPRTRVTTSQRCVRTGDIENVGRTARHQTFFEMLGNFSFGDYFKGEAIPWAWEFLTEVIELPKDKLWGTVYPDDTEAIEIWKSQPGFPQDHIVKMDDNFWEIGPGPCGPDSEIYIDLGEERGCGSPTYTIIYDALDDIKSAMVGMLDKVKKEVVTGQVEVRQVFKISKVGTVAGVLVTEGKVHNKDKAHVIRDGIVIHTAAISALKRYKDDAKEVATGLECGISLVNYNDIEAGAILETFTEIEVEQKLFADCGDSTAVATAYGPPLGSRLPTTLLKYGHNGSRPQKDGAPLAACFSKQNHSNNGRNKRREERIGAGDSRQEI